tara:strand:+ start:247 stop:654 length:408 start_codon:yes stop_codon:yes gene_type:complete
MDKLPDKTVIGAVECPNCGAETPLKVSDKGAFQAVYFHCMRGMEGGGQCRTSARFGEMSSAKMIGEFLINQPPKETATAEETEHVQLSDREEQETKPAAGAAETGGQKAEPIGTNIFGSIRGFFFEPDEPEPAAE